MAKKSFNSGGNLEEKALAEFTSLMIDKLEHLRSDAKWQQPWFSENALGWPKNLSGREYAGGNAIILMLQAEKNKYELPCWATFNRLVALNQQKGKNGEDLPRVMVNKGEKSTSVFLTSYTVVNNETKEKISYEDFKQLDHEEQKDWSVYPKTHVYPIFNVGQTNLKEARPELYAKLKEQNQGVTARREVGESVYPAVDKMIDEQRWLCPIDVGHRDACYYSISKDMISLADRSQFKDNEAFIGTALHEICHSTGSESRLNRFNPPGGFDETARAKEEMTAELTAALICQRAGLRRYVKTDSQPYLKSWLDSLKESPEFIKTVMNDVKRASNMINSKIQDVQLQMDVEKGQQAKQANEPTQKRPAEQSTAYAGTFSLPEWSLAYLVNGDPSDLDDEEIEMVDKFVKEHFPNGFVQNIQWNDATEFNRNPAFGERDPSTLTDKGEYPFCAVKTFPVDFYTFEHKQAQEVETNQKEELAKNEPQEQQEQEEETVSRGWHR